MQHFWEFLLHSQKLYCMSFLFFLHRKKLFRKNQIFLTLSYYIVWINHILFLHSLVGGHCSVPILWLLSILLWTSMYKFLCGHIFSFLLAIYLEAELLGHIETLCLIFQEQSDCFAKWLHHITLPPACMKVPISPHPCQHLLFFCFFLNIAILMHVKWYLIVASICIFLMARDVEYLFIYLLDICISPLEKCTVSPLHMNEFCSENTFISLICL